MGTIPVCSPNGVLRNLLLPDAPLSGLGSFQSKSRSLASYRRRWKMSGTIFSSKPLSAELSAAEQEWLKKLPDKKKPLYSHSLPCIEAWLKKLGFNQSTTDRATWFIERPDWHAQLSLDVTDLYISSRSTTM
ncbi:uncharacterized protein LOC110025637 isoform X2 [Phalaenopsis equestris]|uniref:uncharacterized protein LOC110025637 isoform X2 n=1 Tax=Phalaenopsis equestris TaxID=78828 RepID=UPI0009E20CE3|nr:uncharacterized protein LOC110025637 isoform X2 [Phalaenopsis equestris]